MTELSIKEIRNIQLQMLVFFHNFCEENKITYYMSNGTLLGAVKYAGYIPWDDDIDICMPRSDYEKLIKLWKIQNHLEYKLFSIELDEEYLFPFAKLSNTKTVLIEQNVDNGVELGVNIDIFPLDGYGNAEEEIAQIYNKFSALRTQLMWAKLQPKTTKNIAKRIIKYIISARYKMQGARKICEKMSILARERNYKEDNFVGNSLWGFYSPGEAHDKKVFADKIALLFEGYSFWAPVGYDAYLRKLYGDYSKDPPKEKQVTHHNYKAYQKENI